MRLTPVLSSESKANLDHAVPSAMEAGLTCPSPAGWPWHESESHYGSLFDEAPAALLSIGTDGRIRLANRRALSLLAYRADQLVGGRVLDLYSAGPAGKVKAQELFQRFCVGTEICGQELEMQRGDGARVWVSLSVRPIRDADRLVVASCSMVEEIGGPRSFGSEHVLRFGRSGVTDFGRSMVALADDLRTTSTNLERVLIKSAGTASILKINEIDWLEAAGNYVQVHAGTRSWLLRRTMNHMEAALDPRQFLRIHRSTIVNVDCIKELRPCRWGDYQVIVRNGVLLTLSRSYRKKLSGQLRELR